MEKTVMNNIIEKLKELAVEYPAFAASESNLLKLAAEHPEWTKISDFPPFSSFSAIEWDNEKVLKLFLKTVPRIIAKELNNYSESARKGQTMIYMGDLIQRLAICNFVANAFQVMSDVKDDPGYKESEFVIQYCSRAKETN